MGMDLLALESSDAAFLAVAFIVGVIATYFAERALGKSKLAEAENTIKTRLDEAQTKGGAIVKAAEVDAKAEFINRREEIEAESRKVKNELRDQEKRLTKREDNLERKLDTLGSKEKALETESKKLQTREGGIAEREEE